jgi:uncharacterized protein (DUF1786 family)
MQILSVDVGTGTQDIYLFRSGMAIENGLKLVMPSPTMFIRSQIQKATKRGEKILLTGVMMGGGPCHWAAEAHIKAGLPLFATPEAARTFNDDLDWIEKEMGVVLIDEEDAMKRSDMTAIAMGDFDYAVISSAFRKFGIDLEPQAVAVAVFDHGAAPPEVSDRQFRFDYLKDRIEEVNSLTAFAFLAEKIPSIMTRMQAVAKSASGIECPLVVMDTAPAAVLGATLDAKLSQRERLLVANVGNFHTLAFRLGPIGIEAVFEHHTGLIDPHRLDELLTALADGSLTHEAVFDDHGHGALTIDPTPLPLEGEGFGVAVTGPRRSMMTDSRLRPYFAVPFGDMMLTGCFGLLVAVADNIPELAGPIHEAFSGAGADTSPWDADPR